MHFLRCLILSLIFCVFAKAHQVPNMTIESTFEASGDFELKINLDPRVFLSSIPTSLPPVAAEWFLQQSPEQVEVTFKTALQHIQKHLVMSFSGEVLSLAGMTFEAMDGATNKPVTVETTETHLLGRFRGSVSAGKNEFVLSFAREAQVSLILLMKTHEMAEPRVQVLFPGETSRPLKIAAASPAPTITPQREAGWLGWLAWSTVLVAAVWCVVTRRKR